jgi:hypothetical protein
MSKAIAKAEAANQVPVPANEGATILGMIDRVMAMPDVPVEKVAQLFELQQKAQAEHARREFLVALAQAEAEMEPIRKDARNPDTKSKYATHAALDAAMRPIYTKHGFSFSWNTGLGDGSPIPPDSLRVLGTLSHKLGHERPLQIDMPCDGKGAKGGAVMSRTHATGSAFSYGKRYLQGGAFNIVFAGDDDDGNRAGKTPPPSAPNAFDPISDVQLNELIALADEVGADKRRFCKFYGIQSFADITVSDFAKAKAALLAKGKK